MCDVYGFNERKKKKSKATKLTPTSVWLQSKISKFGKRDEKSIVMASNLRRSIIKWDARMWNWLTFIILIHDGLIAKPRSGLTWTSDQFIYNLRLESWESRLQEVWEKRKTYNGTQRNSQFFSLTNVNQQVCGNSKAIVEEGKTPKINQSTSAMMMNDDYRAPFLNANVSLMSSQFPQRRENSKENNMRMIIILDFSACSTRRARSNLHRAISRLFFPSTPAGAFNFFWSSCFLSKPRACINEVM